MKHRLTKDQRAKVRGTLAQFLVRMGLDEDETPEAPAATIVLSGAMHDCGELAPAQNGTEPVAVECARLAAAMYRRNER